MAARVLRRLKCPRCGERIVVRFDETPTATTSVSTCPVCGETMRDAVVERRSSRRYPMARPVVLVYRGRKWTGAGINISHEGISIAVQDVDLTEGDLVKVQIPTESDRPLVLAGRVVWARPALRDDGSFDRAKSVVGVAFDLHRSSLSDLKRLQEYIGAP